MTLKEVVVSGADAIVSNVGLVIVVIGALVLCGLLIDDGFRAVTGQVTFTEWATASGKAYRKWLLVGATATIPVALWVHFQFFSNS